MNDTAQLISQSTPQLTFRVGDRVHDEVRGCDGTLVRIDREGLWFYPDSQDGRAQAVLCQHETLSPIDPAETGRASTFYSAASLEGAPIPSREWVVDGLVPKRVVTSLYGDGGVGKSLYALQLAHAVATEGKWAGRDVTGGNVVFVSAEDDEHELHRRLSDIIRNEGGDFSELDRLTLRSLAGEDALLATLNRSTGVITPSPLFNELDQRLHDEAPELLVLDTLADLFPGDENNRAQVTQFVGLLIGLAVRHECGVLLLAHPSRSGMTSGSGDGGSTAWHGKVRSRLYMQRVVQEGYEPNPDVRTLTNKKLNYGRTGTEITLTWRAGVFHDDAPESGIDRMAAGAKAERVFLKLLRTLTDQGRRVNHAGGTSYAPKLFAEHPEAEGVNKRAFRTAMEALLTDRKIKITEDGPPSKRRTFLEVAE
ncbi:MULTISPECIES: AAA family ATPase [Hyphomonas]|uniref:ATPase n=1 Tax=Hyphomonas adhaerens TaxID=81029 RepID=A0A3B9GUD7_9PROT|nr:MULTISPECIES: AAA family ATPase [Hyphomonas]MBB41759.1 ATPase [Hyphomonas sp.]HAE26059.1 ATPase [Hyphomonas adhaerens]|tara:strand:+ start:11624 stop:12895 length:1272 start_codon:yes stop_codon:yes gene_type:complete